MSPPNSGAFCPIAADKGYWRQEPSWSNQYSGFHSRNPFQVHLDVLCDVWGAHCSRALQLNVAGGIDVSANPNEG